MAHEPKSRPIGDEEDGRFLRGDRSIVTTWIARVNRFPQVVANRRVVLLAMKKMARSSEAIGQSAPN
ncbi:hypothetical protein [Laspinema olomoucense]|uniref:Uncharacterized protein n=1 Tax=Laspinema olomoucense D3b TaxID=2953688 RepID=A0ABT2NEG6_9CYAN|nr:hypothetical protein [Laspinema sp. D3b]MCT7981098.1 hypothetical protein [Laspinema sp. D3b]